MVRKKNETRKKAMTIFCSNDTSGRTYQRTYQSPEQHKINYLVIFDSEIVTSPFEMCNLWSLVEVEVVIEE